MAATYATPLHTDWRGRQGTGGGGWVGGQGGEQRAVTRQRALAGWRRVPVATPGDQRRRWSAPVTPWRVNRDCSDSAALAIAHCLIPLAVSGFSEPVAYVLSGVPGPGAARYDAALSGSRRGVSEVCRPPPPPPPPPPIKSLIPRPPYTNALLVTNFRLMGIQCHGPRRFFWCRLNKNAL